MDEVKSDWLDHGDHRVQLTQRLDDLTDSVIISLKCDNCGAHTQGRFTKYEMVLNPTMIEDFSYQCVRLFKKKFPESCSESMVMFVHES